MPSVSIQRLVLCAAILACAIELPRLHSHPVGGSHDCFWSEAGDEAKDGELDQSFFLVSAPVNVVRDSFRCYASVDETVLPLASVVPNVFRLRGPPSQLHS